jgi:hypothetical protein
MSPVGAELGGPPLPLKWVLVVAYEPEGVSP